MLDSCQCRRTFVPSFCFNKSPASCKVRYISCCRLLCLVLCVERVFWQLSVQKVRRIRDPTRNHIFLRRRSRKTLLVLPVECPCRVCLGAYRFIVSLYQLVAPIYSELFCHRVNSEVSLDSAARSRAPFFLTTCRSPSLSLFCHKRCDSSRLFANVAFLRTVISFVVLVLRGRASSPMSCLSSSSLLRKCRTQASDSSSHITILVANMVLLLKCRPFCGVLRSHRRPHVC